MGTPLVVQLVVVLAIIGAVALFAAGVVMGNTALAAGSFVGGRSWRLFSCSPSDANT